MEPCVKDFVWKADKKIRIKMILCIKLTAGQLWCVSGIKILKLNTLRNSSLQKPTKA